MSTAIKTNMQSLLAEEFKNSDHAEKQYQATSGVGNFLKSTLRSDAETPRKPKDKNIQDFGNSANGVKNHVAFQGPYADGAHPDNHNEGVQPDADKVQKVIDKAPQLTNQLTNSKEHTHNNTPTHQFAPAPPGYR